MTNPDTIEKTQRRLAKLDERRAARARDLHGTPEQQARIKRALDEAYGDGFVAAMFYCLETQEKDKCQTNPLNSSS